MSKNDLSLKELLLLPVLAPLAIGIALLRIVIETPLLVVSLFTRRTNDHSAAPETRGTNLKDANP